MIASGEDFNPMNASQNRVLENAKGLVTGMIKHELRRLVDHTSMDWNKGPEVVL